LFGRILPDRPPLANAAAKGLPQRVGAISSIVSPGRLNQHHAMCVTAQESRALSRLFGLLAEDIGGHAWIISPSQRPELRHRSQDRQPTAVCPLFRGQG
jgi:hypothetical protein